MSLRSSPFGLYIAAYLVLLTTSHASVPARYYRTLAEALAANGFSVLQYERADTMPSAPVDSAFWEPLMQWRSNVNSSANSSFCGVFGTEVAVAGHSMGGALASVAAGSHADEVNTAFLMDPVDWDNMSNRVSATYLARFNKPVVIVSIGIHCMDRAGCYEPTNCSQPISTGSTSSGCEPSWWCCDWDHGFASASGRITQGSRIQPNGAQSFWSNAPQNSWQIYLPDFGHMSFLDYDPQTDPEQLLSCPDTVPHTDIQPMAQSLLVDWMSHAMNGAPLGTDWTSDDGGCLKQKMPSS